MNGLWSIVLKEIKHLQRDRTTIFIALMLPLLQLVIFGYAVDFDVRHIQTVAVDLDHSRDSRQYLAQLHAGQYIDFVASVQTPDEAAKMLKTGVARVAVTIPPDFSRKIAQGQNPQVGVMLDGSDAQVSVRARFAFVDPPTSLPTGTPQARINVLFNPDSRTSNFMIPGLIAVILQVVTVGLTAFSIVREKEQGTLEQLMVTPVSRLGLMVGKLIPYAILAMIELSVILFLSSVVFGIQPHGSIIALFLMSVPFVVASLSIGLLISTVAQTQGQALQFTMMLLMPSILLSGYISPRETMPGWLYIVSFGFPATHYIQITRGIIIRGAGAGDLIGPCAILCLIAGLLIVVATTRFRKSIA
jgi:ABC transporter DrrB family efflux protein